MESKLFKNEKGLYEYAGLEYEDIELMIQDGILDFCCCGNNEANLLYVKNGLMHINNRYDNKKDKDTFDVWFKKWHEEGLKIFGNEESRYFFFYWCDKEGYTEHGSCIPGWLTNRGTELLELLKEYELNRNNNGSKESG